MTHSRDGLITLSRFRMNEQPRDPATAGVRVMVAVRRSFPIACGLQDRTRSPCVGGVIPTVLDVSSLNSAGWVRSAGDFLGMGA